MENNNTMIPTLKDAYSEMHFNTDGLVDFYTSVADEYDSLVHGIGIRNVSYYKKIFIHGKESLNLLHRLTTNHVIDLSELEWEKTIFTNTEGNIIERTLLLRFEDYFLLLGLSIQRNKLLKWIQRFIVSDDISATDVSNDYNMYEIIGPESQAYISLLLGDRELQDNKIIRAQVENYFIHCIKFSDVNNVNKFIVVVESKFTDSLTNYFISNTSVFNLNFVGEKAYEIFRIERGIPVVPNELNDQFNPCEANLEAELDTEKDGYIGCEQIKQTTMNQGTRSKLSGILFHDKLNDDILNLTIHNENGEQVGVITSIISSHTLENSIGMGYIDSDIAQKEFLGVNGTQKYKITLTDFPIKR
ncbi:hypothetical protein MNBD_IGNAVI01-3044 [hydrothermal vent metagenome]|uniref:Aminomethyltransferase folate-binding domain-containing protein n=1 Tax=hydrothermal vent metagenome TaxID=652676 RepID=A0A3B1CFR1_9ZZZZ